MCNFVISIEGRNPDELLKKAKTEIEAKGGTLDTATRQFTFPKPNVIGSYTINGYDIVFVITKYPPFSCSIIHNRLKEYLNS
jgi:hypothetical protein